MSQEHLVLKGIENYKRAIEETVKEPNKTDILKFYRYIDNKGFGLSYKIQILRYLCQMAQIVNKPFRDVNRDDMVDYMEQIRKPRQMRIGSSMKTRSYSVGTMRSIIGIVKYFFQWIYELNGSYPSCVSWIENTADSSQISQDDIITVEELHKLVSTCKNDRDRAFMQVIFDTGARITEFLEIRRKDVRFDNFGAVIKIMTEKRKRETNPFRLVRISASVPALERWLRQIPDDPDQFVWTDIYNRKKRMTYDATYYVMKFAMKRAGLKKKIYPHLFRHSSVSYWHSRGLPEGVLKRRMGWRPGSKMLNRYSHITDNQSDGATLKVLGFENTGNNEIVQKKTCPRCGTDNEFSNFCSRCSFPLNDNASAQLVEKQRKFEKIMSKAEQDPRFGKILEVMEEIMSRPPQ